ncbi:MAG: CD225/dispanin family protein [Coriobacteriia bacterium]|nr:CD225/dispanin family protein [Coriobacteriia bacterium]
MGACKWCGAENVENVVTCANCGQSLGAGEEPDTFDAEASGSAASAQVDEQTAAGMADAGPPPVAAVPPAPESPPPVTPVPVAPAAPQAPVVAAPVPMAAPQYAPPPQQPAYAPPPQQPAYAPPQQYAAPPQQYPPPQQYGYTQPPTQPPKSGLGNAIAVTILCCLPLGIVSIVYATQVDKKWAMGDYAGSQQAAKKANMWASIAAAVGIVWIIVSGIIGYTTAETNTTTTPYYYTY